MNTIGFDRVDWADFQEGRSGYVYYFDFVNTKILAFKSNGTSALQQEANATDLSAVTIRARFEGI